MNERHEPICFDVCWWFNGGMKMPTPSNLPNPIAIRRILKDRQDAKVLG
jgi:hypothetical protein